MKEYQQKKMRSYVMPEAVYRQALWALKDLPRLREELKQLVEERDLITSGALIVSDVTFGTGKISDSTGNRAVKIANISSRILAIESAFAEIPDKYRKGLWIRNIENAKYEDGAHPNTWKKWQQILIFHIAQNLQLY
jgi:hypothetical protein